MKLTRLFALAVAMLLCVPGTTYAQRNMRLRTIPIDSMVMSDPCILADDATQMYYMTGTGGMLWKSPDLKMWTGPYRVAVTDGIKWAGERPEIWAAELHKYNGKYYYFATFTNNSIRIGEFKGNVIPRRASHILVSDKAEGPYRPVGKSDYLPADRPTLDGTFWVDKDNNPYMIFCGEWLENWNGTIEKIRLKKDLSAPVGKSKVLFRAFDSPWSREKDIKGNDIPNKVTDGPWLFRTQTGKLGMLWTSWVFGDYTQGVAYSESGTLDGPWIQEKEPITPPNYGHGMLFRTFDGRLMMSVHSHEKVNGRTRRVPHLFPVNDSGDKIKVIAQEEKMDAYLMVYHKDQDHGLHMAYSEDGYTWTAFNDDKPIIAGDTIAEQHGIRDPHIYRGKDGAYFLAMTDLHVFGVRDGFRKTEWERDGKKYGWGNNRGMVFMKSYDLIHWTHYVIDFTKFPKQQYVVDGDTLTMNWSEVGCVWAPETVFDEEAGKMMVHFTTREGVGMNTIWYVYMNDAFDKVIGEPHFLLSAPKLKYNIIDSDIIKVADTYHMFYVSHESGATPRHATSQKITGPYRLDDYYYDGERQGHEAPNCWRRLDKDSSEPTYVVMFDNYHIRPMNFGFVETKDFFTYKPIGYFDGKGSKMKRTNFAEQKHGAVTYITKEELERLKKYWSK